MNFLIENADHEIQYFGKKIPGKIKTSTISNNLQYVVSGGENQHLKIWDLQANILIKVIEIGEYIQICKFTDDSKILYVGTRFSLYQFFVLNEFKQSKLNLFGGCSQNVYCITNTIILVSFSNGMIIEMKSCGKMIFKFQAHNNIIQGLDYFRHRQMIATASLDGSIKLWNERDRSLFIQKLNAHNYNQIYQVIFVIRNNQLLSLDFSSNIKIWNINYQQRQLEQNYLLENAGYNMSLVLNQQYIITVGDNIIKIYTINRQLIRTIRHDIDNIHWFNTIQVDSMEAVVIQGQFDLMICKISHGLIN